MLRAIERGRIRKIASRMTYRHTQTGWVVWATCIGLLVLFEFVPSPGGRPEIFLPVCMSLLLAILALMGALTVEVDDAAIRLRFGIGLVRKSFSLVDIDSCQPVRNRWWWGWGIRSIPQGWLYNVSRLDAVELTLKNGKVFRIGTDEPRTLADVIQARLRKPV